MEVRFIFFFLNKIIHKVIKASPLFWILTTVLLVITQMVCFTYNCPASWTKRFLCSPCSIFSHHLRCAVTFLYAGVCFRIEERKCSWTSPVIQLKSLVLASDGQSEGGTIDLGLDQKCPCSAEKTNGGFLLEIKLY